MNKEYFLNLKTLEIKEDIPDYVLIDKDIIETIKILNQKGYVTTFCCAGHNETLFTGEQECHNMSFLEDVKTSSHYMITYIGKDFFKYKNEIVGSQTYICFNKIYDIKEPKGFYIENNPFSIRKDLNYYVDDLRKTDAELAKEIKENNDMLYDWAKQLPDIRKK